LEGVSKVKPQARSPFVPRKIGKNAEPEDPSLCKVGTKREIPERKWLTRQNCHHWKKQREILRVLNLGPRCLAADFYRSFVGDSVGV
jgi:hypothetical protein